VEKHFIKFLNKLLSIHEDYEWKIIMNHYFIAIDNNCQIYSFTFENGNEFIFYNQSPLFLDLTYFKSTLKSNLPHLTNDELHQILTYAEYLIDLVKKTEKISSDEEKENKREDLIQRTSPIFCPRCGSKLNKDKKGLYCPNCRWFPEDEQIIFNSDGKKEVALLIEKIDYALQNYEITNAEIDETISYLNQLLIQIQLSQAKSKIAVPVMDSYIGKQVLIQYINWVNEKTSLSQQDIKEAINYLEDWQLNPKRKTDSKKDVDFMLKSMNDVFNTHDISNEEIDETINYLKHQIIRIQQNQISLIDVFVLVNNNIGLSSKDLQKIINYLEDWKLKPKKTKDAMEFKTKNAREINPSRIDEIYFNTKQYIFKPNEIKQYSQLELDLGREVEKEHLRESLPKGIRDRLAEIIAKHHLAEMDNYYSELAKIEKIQQ
jgi:rRNA maturation endonuclease Nob1